MIQLTIGRDQETAKLRVVFGKQFKLFGKEGSVPMSVSRQHCRIDYDADSDSFSITNLKPGENTTSVNGLTIQSKALKETDSVTLGSDGYCLPLADIIAAVPRPVSIAPLEAVWNDYKERKYRIERHAQLLNVGRGATGILTMVAMIVGSIPGMESARLVLYCVAAVLVAAFIYLMYRNVDKKTRQQQELNDYIHDNYLCPKCKRFLGAKDYKFVLQDGECPYCHTKYKP